MGFLHKMVGLVGIAILVLAFAGIVKGARSPDPGDWERLMQSVTSLAPLQVVCYGIAVFAFLAIYALTAIPNRRRRRLLSFDNEGGTVSISTDAICDYIGKLSSEFPSVVKLNPEVIAARSFIDLIVGVRIKAGPHIHEVCELLQKRVRESVTNGLGISKIRRVEVSVSDIVSEHNPV